MGGSEPGLVRWPQPHISLPIAISASLTHSKDPRPCCKSFSDLNLRFGERNKLNGGAEAEQHLCGQGKYRKGFEGLGRALKWRERACRLHARPFWALGRLAPACLLPKARIASDHDICQCAAEEWCERRTAASGGREGAAGGSSGGRGLQREEVVARAVQTLPPACSPIAPPHALLTGGPGPDAQGRRHHGWAREKLGTTDCKLACSSCAATSMPPCSPPSCPLCQMWSRLRRRASRRRRALWQSWRWSACRLTSVSRAAWHACPTRRCDAPRAVQGLIHACFWACKGRDGNSMIVDGLTHLRCLHCLFR